MNVPVQDWVAHNAVLYPEKLAMVDLDSHRQFSYRAFSDRIGYLAGYLARCGLAPGDRVAVLSQNSTDIFEFQFACLRTGIILVPLNWRLAAAELAYILRDATPKLFFFDPAFRDKAAPAARDAGVRTLQTIDYGSDSDYEAGIAQNFGLSSPTPLGSRDPWIILYTSGTTGKPKGVIVTYEMMFFNAVNVTAPLKITRDSRGVTFLPTFHIGGFNSYANPLFLAGGTTYVPRAFNARTFFDLHASKEVRITHSGGVPTQLQLMSEEDGFTDADLSHLEVMAVGGAAVPGTLINCFARKGVALNNAWGMTETAGMATILRSEDAAAHIGSCGQKVMFSDLKIVSRDGRNTNPGDVGEIYIRGPIVTPGYWKNDEATTNAFDSGWFRTGDAAVVDEEGYFKIVDRWKDMFISGGENIYPAEVEDAIRRLDAVSEAAVVGIPHPKWGEVGRAFIVSRTGHKTLTHDEVIDHCRDQLARYKVPAEVCFVDDLPKNASGKVMKHLLPRD